MKRLAKKYIAIASLSGGMFVALSAFAAHGLKGGLPEQMLVIFHTAAQYQIYHSLALLITAVLSLYFSDNKLLTWGARFFVAGIVVFSGSLYTLALTGISWLGAITPIGGVCLILGWLMLAVFALKLPEIQQECSIK
ncbi:DUF423 domain-containing protein [Candidatus Sororendozoicomonas aggregata]|uniref:DUF423 domain-containing protein n=1 Tax=Candidatus Sororendozoicomonas aggregata TaxID=3073239 RepID=UPI002ED600FB